jgi:hypothetical protein
MTAGKPHRTAVDYLVIGLSPVLIMLLVGSLTFFLIEVFFRGEGAGSVRWVMFWFVMAVVLVSRIAIENSSGQAAVYGLGLAVATWLYLVRVHPAFILGAVLLAIVWWCAHKLTFDCTLIDEDDDASGGGLLQTASQTKSFRWFGKKAAQATATTQAKPAKPPAAPHPPGLWVVWFSVAALPLFGIGQTLLPADDSAAREAGFRWLFLYVSAALGLLLTTSFLGLRRYLRQRFLPMPGMIAFGWLRFGAGVAVQVLLGALLLPRPGATAAWHTLSYQINHQLRQASEYAARFGPHGTGSGRAGEQLDPSAQEKNATGNSGTEKAPGESPDQVAGKSPQTSNTPPPPASPPIADQIFKWLRALFFLVVAGLIAWWLFRQRALLLSMAQSFLAALKKFWSDLFRWGSSPADAAARAAKTKPQPHRFATYRNPFLLGADAAWPPERLVAYSYEALQAWAEERGIAPHPEQTAREFCAELAGRFPEITDDLAQMSHLYGYAAYGTAVPPGRDLEPVKNVWRFLGG